ncbi:hypothetical protein AVEN_241137-1 [Araneus ventricosus]|uniref:Uncharacterized protein n=1 Tax=Araneus ventricosus TaxID=182803 RepID=A0A4Y2GJT6_ARAVE|nr:hypothetical protein AVEN_241137-1 [Araneus ventricosus]
MLLLWQFICTPLHPFVATLFFPTHSSRKIRHVHSSEVPKRAGSRGQRSSLPLYCRSSIPPFPSLTPPISDLQPSSQGSNLGKLFDLTATLERGPALESEH